MAPSLPRVPRLAARVVFVLLAAARTVAAQDAPPAGTPRVGPARGTVIVVGGGAMGPEIHQAFLQAAGGPEAAMVSVPNAGGADRYGDEAPGTRSWRGAGARQVRTFFTKDRAVADADSFAGALRDVRGVWFEGGRQFRLVDAYAGTRTEAAFRAVLERGGVVGGSSAGASILGDFLVRGAPSNDNFIMDHPAYRRGFAYLRGVAIDQHVVARERLDDMADSIIPRYPQLLGISEDEGTAWVIRGDTGTIVGRGQAFVYNGADPTDPGKPFLTLYPGDRYDLGARRVLSRAGDGSPVTRAFLDSLFARWGDPAAGGATVLVAQGGHVLASRAYGVAPQRKHMPETTLAPFRLGAIAAVFDALCAQQPPAPARGGDSAAARRPAQTPLQRCVTQWIGGATGARRLVVDSTGAMQGSVDELYRVSLGLEQGTLARPVRDGGARAALALTGGWARDTVALAERFRAFGTPDGRRAAWVRIPARRVSVLVLTGDDTADARALADAIVARLLPAGR